MKHAPGNSNTPNSARPKIDQFKTATSFPKTHRIVQVPLIEVHMQFPCPVGFPVCDLLVDFLIPNTNFSQHISMVTGQTQEGCTIRQHQLIQAKFYLIPVWFFPHGRPKMQWGSSHSRFPCWAQGPTHEPGPRMSRLLVASLDLTVPCISIHMK